MARARITKAERNQIQKLRIKALAKYRRLTQRGVDEALLIKTPTMQQISNLDRQGVNAVKTNLKRFTDRNVDKYQFVKTDTGAYISKRTALQIKAKQRQLDAQMTAQEKKFDKQKFYPASDVPSDVTVKDMRDVVKDQGKHPRYTRGINTFESQKEAENYLNRISEYDADWIGIKNLIFKQNFLDSLIDAYGDDAEDILDFVNDNLTPDALAFLSATHEVLTIEYQYSWVEREERLARIRSVLGMG